MGDFNLESDDPCRTSFLKCNSFTNLIKTNICFKGARSCIDLILTNRRYHFQYTRSYETGLSDHHHMIYTKKHIYKNQVKDTEAVARRCSVKTVLNKLAKFSFSQAHLFKSAFFYKAPPVAASEATEIPLL